MHTHLLERNVMKTPLPLSTGRKILKRNSVGGSALTMCLIILAMFTKAVRWMARW